MSCYFVVRSKEESKWIINQFKRIGFKITDIALRTEETDFHKRFLNDPINIFTIENGVVDALFSVPIFCSNDVIIRVAELEFFKKHQKESEEQKDKQEENKPSDDVIFEVKTNKNFETDVIIKQCSTFNLARIISGVVLDITDKFDGDFEMKLIAALIARKMRKGGGNGKI